MISIIVPVYNAYERIPKMMESLLKQSYSDKEIILIDDGSTDDSGSLCDKYKEKYPDIVRTIHKKNEGVAAARNAGLAYAKGEFIAWCDADDFMNFDLLEQLHNEMVAYDADIVVSYFNVIRNGRDYLPKMEKENCVYSGQNFVRVFDNFYNEKRGITTVLWNKLYRRKVFDDVRFVEGDSYEDKRIMHLLMNNADKIVYTNFWGYNYVINDEGITRKRNLKTEFDDYYATLDRYHFMQKTADTSLIQNSTRDLFNKLIDLYALCKQQKKMNLCKELLVNFRNYYKKTKLRGQWKSNLKYKMFNKLPDLYIALAKRGNV